MVRTPPGGRDSCATVTPSVKVISRSEWLEIRRSSVAPLHSAFSSPPGHEGRCELEVALHAAERHKHANDRPEWELGPCRRRHTGRPDDLVLRLAAQQRRRDRSELHRPINGSSLYSGRTIPLRSVWLAVDVETGRYTVATPTGFDLTPLPISSTAFRRDLDGIAGVYDLQELAAEVLVVRPRAGAWRLRAFEGGSGDADHLRNGRMSLPVESTTPVPGTTASPPRHLRKGDIIAIIEPNRLELFVVEIDR